MKHLLSIGLLLFTSITFGQKKVVLNTFHKDSVTFYIGFQKLHETFNYLQAAQKFSTDNAGSMLRQVDIHRLVVPLKDNEPKLGEPANTTFLLNIYEVDSLTGAPGASLTREPLKLKNEANSIIKIDLTKFNVIIPGKTFFVGIEWLHDQRNQRFMSTHSDEFELRKSSETDDLIYQPLLGMVKNKKTTSDAWVMTPEHKWILYTHNLPYMTDLSISAHIISK